MDVTPCVGVWIEIHESLKGGRIEIVTPCVGVWIEILYSPCKLCYAPVTPCVGVWIEISVLITFAVSKKSLPAWECGLK